MTKYKISLAGIDSVADEFHLVALIEAANHWIAQDNAMAAIKALRELKIHVTLMSVDELF